MTDGQSVVRRVHEPAGLQHGGIPGGSVHGIKRDAVGPQHVGIDEHLKLLVPLAPDRDVGDAGDRHQAGPDGPHDDIGEFLLAELVRPDADLQDATGGGERLQNHRWAGDRGQPAGLGRDAFLHHLPDRQGVAAVLQDHDDLRQAEHRLGTQRLHLRDAVEGVFEWHGDEVFDFLGGKPRGLGLNLDDRRGELREHVERCRPDRPGTDDHQDDAQGEHDDPKPDGRFDEGRKHRMDFAIP